MVDLLFRMSLMWSVSFSFFGGFLFLLVNVFFLCDQFLKFCFWCSFCGETHFLILDACLCLFIGISVYSSCCYLHIWIFATKILILKHHIPKDHFFTSLFIYDLFFLFLFILDRLDLLDRRFYVSWQVAQQIFFLWVTWVQIVTLKLGG